MKTLDRVTEKASELGENLKDFSRSAGDRLQGMREGTGNALHGAADTFRKGSAAVEDFASGAAGRLDAAGKFVESCTSRRMLAKARNFGKNHLTGTLIVVAAVGFLAGMSVSRPARSRA